ncbi:MAG: elongation factor G [Candidatus Omnitrophica bacterium]|jgi:elongation factor G|nr:elongation factor G [Candidatus Omnitrophota bacterium]
MKQNIQKIKQNDFFTMTEIEKIRNIGIIAHIDAGKTTTTERLLYYTGRISRIGEVDEGTTTMDWMDQEKERGITITSAATTCYWKDYKINIIDTPGHVDFTAEVERSLRVLDGVIGIFCGVSGVQPQSETVWRQSEHYKIPKIIYINKLDRVGADFLKVVQEIEKDMGITCLILHLPIGKENEFKGIVDIIENHAIYYSTDNENNARIEPVPEDMKQEVEFYKTLLLERLSEIDHNIMEKYLEEEPIETLLIKNAIRKATLERKFFPVFCGSSFKNKGAKLLLDAIIDYLPSPIDRGEIIGENPETEGIEKRYPDIKDKISILAFKLFNDIHFGHLVYARIYSGELKQGSKLYNWTRNRKERVLKILEAHGNRYTEIESAKAGDIVAIVGLKGTYTGDTLAPEEDPVILEKMQFPEPVLTMAVEPKTKADSEKVFQSLIKLSEEDPTFKLRVNSETGQTVISGMGQLHIEVLIEKMRRQYNVDAKLGRPEVAYKETVTGEAIGEGKFIKQSGGRGHYGHVVLKIKPSTEETDFIFKSELKGEVIPKEFLPSIKSGVKESVETAGFYGYPVINVEVSVIDGSFHPVDSNDIAFKIAASIAFKDALKKAKPILLEPIMKIEITTPQEFLGEIISDFNTRNGKIEKMEDAGNYKIINGSIPLRTIFDYTTIIRSLTQGRASYIIEPSFYQKVPDEYLKNIIE